MARSEDQPQQNFPLVTSFPLSIAFLYVTEQSAVRSLYLKKEVDDDAL